MSKESAFTMQQYLRNTPGMIDTMLAVFSLSSLRRASEAKIHASRVVMLVVAVLVAEGELCGQTQTPVSVSGSLNLSGELYSSQGVSQRRSRTASRAILRSTISLYDQIILPFELYVTTEERGFRQPFNQFGASPKFFGWLTLHGGYFSSQLSEFTFGDTRILGGGIELNPGKFRFAALYGRTQEAVEADSVGGFAGTYKRMMFATKIGYGTDESFVDFNVFTSYDDSSSIKAPPAGSAPTENLATSLSFGFPLFASTLRLRSEIAIAAFSSDTRSREVGDFGQTLKSLFTPRTSSQVDGAVKLSIQYTASEAFSLGVNSRWVGPGYVTLGYAQLPNDVFEVSLSPAVRLIGNRLSLRPSLGLRWNNLRSNRLATTQRTILNFTGSYQATDAFGIDAHYANYGMRSSPRNDTLRVDNISQSLTLSPRLTFESLGGSNLAAISYSLQDFTDKNILTSATNQNTTNTVTGVWSISFPSALSFTTSYSYVQSTAPLLKTRIQSVGETVGYAFFENTLTISLSGTYNSIHTISSEGQVTGSLTAAYSLGRAGTVTASAMTNTYKYDNSLAGSSFTESQGSLQYSYSF